MHDLLKAIESRSKAMTIKDVAELLNVSDKTIYRMVAKKQIPYFRVAGSVRFNPASLGLWLRKQDPMATKASKASKDG